MCVDFVVTNHGDIRKSGIWGAKPHLKWGPKAPSLADLLLCLDRVRKVLLG